ncbi:MAG: ribonuclease P protein component [Eubacteriales bacterium]
MKRKYSIKENHLFARAYKSPKSSVAWNLVVYVLKNRDKRAFTRVGITVSRKNGIAVRRNRVKRIVREALRQLYPRLKEGSLIIIVARKPCYDKTHKTGQVLKSLDKAFRELELYRRTDI